MLSKKAVLRAPGMRYDRGYAVAVLSMERPLTDSSRRGRRSGSGQSERRYPRVADALRDLRRAHRLTQEDVAPILGLSFAGYRPYERGERELTHAQIEMLAAALGVPTTDVTRRIWPVEAATPDTPDELADALYARGFRPDEAPLVETLVTDLARRSPRQRRDLLELLGQMVRVSSSGD